jgi:hypothetical protein
MGGFYAPFYKKKPLNRNPFLDFAPEEHICATEHKEELPMNSYRNDLLLFLSEFGLNCN